MTEVRGSRDEMEPDGGRGLAPEIRRDLEALDARSRHGLRAIHETRRAVLGETPDAGREGGFMPGFRVFKMRPGLATLAVAGAIAIALLVVPIPYEKTTAHQVALVLGGDSVSPDAVKSIAGEFKKALGVESVQVTAERGADGTDYTLRASMPGNAGGAASAVSAAFARSLMSRGYLAEASVTPVRERVSGSVYAMVTDNVIRVEVQGKDAAQIEAEIAAQLAAAGIPDAQVSVQMDGDNQMSLSVLAERDGPIEGEAAPPPEIVLTVNGEEPDGVKEANEVRVMRRHGDAGEELVVEYVHAGGTATATVANPAALNDQDLAAEVLRQLTALGVTDISVSSEGGRISILNASELGGVQGTAESKRSWGQVKKEMASKPKP